ncbi:MAG: hypothetical protein ACOCVN_02485, partial [bacterium]
MKKPKRKFQFLLLILSFLLMMSCGGENSNDLYVSPSGDDGNPGTLEAPLASFEGARDKIREMKKNNSFPAKGITVYFREGNYYVSNTIELDEQDSGNENGPIVYTRYKDEKVSFQGGVAVNPKDFKRLEDTTLLNRIIDTAAREKIMMLNLKEQGLEDYGEFSQYGFSIAIKEAPMELYVNEKPMTIAKWPNEGRVDIVDVLDKGSLPIEEDFSGRGATIKYGYDRVKYWTNVDEIWLWGYFK